MFLITAVAITLSFIYSNKELITWNIVITNIEGGGLTAQEANYH